MSYVALNLGGLPGASGSTLSVANGVNGNGTLIVGSAFDSGGIQQPVYWDAAGTIHQLPTLSGGGALDTDAALGCSVDGTTIVGASDPGTGTGIAVVWTGGPSWTITNLGALAGAPNPKSSSAFACSATGFIITGSSQDATTGTNAGRPCVWVNQGISSLPLVAATEAGNGAFSSFTGETMVGNCSDLTLAGPAAVWSGGPPLWAVAPLPRLGASALTDQALACSFNGQIIVGNAWDFSNQEFAVTWTPNISKIGGTYGGAFSSANGCDATGTYIVGNDPSGNAVLWIGLAGQLLPLFAGQTGGQPATGISYDATVIVGSGLDASNRVVAVRWKWSGAPPPPLIAPAVLNMANVVVTSLATESPCTIAQYTTPPGVSPAVGLRWSDTRGQTFGNPVAQALSSDPLTQLQWNRTGYARDRVFELFWSAAAKTALNGAFVFVEPWKS